LHSQAVQSPAPAESSSLRPGRFGTAVALIALLATACTRGGSTEGHGASGVRLATRAIAYAPRGYDPRRPGSVTAASVERDLRTLRAVGFRSLVTYGSGGALGDVPSIARRVGFDDLLVMGIWDPTDEEEMTNALRQARNVDAYCVGNEGLAVRYSAPQLLETMQRLRAASGRPVTTSERIGDYLSGPHHEWLMTHSDWLFPTAHPYWYGRRDVPDATQWITTHYDVLAAQTQRPVILKEASFPTIADIAGSEQQQVQLFSDLEGAGISFFYFEAYDQDWKSRHPDYSVDDAHWGLFRTDGSPKPIVSWIADHPIY
jgi:exo-beta-1,3-glucanase (GH17 family)